MFNGDRDDQWSDCTLSTGAGTTVNIPGWSGANQQSIAAEDLLSLTSAGTASLHCHTYNGYFRTPS